MERRIMKASKLIRQLQRLVTEHGDLCCVLEDSEFGDFWEVTGAKKDKVRMIRNLAGPKEDAFVIEYQ